MLRVTPLILIAALAIPAAAEAAPVKVKSAGVDAGTLSVTAANPNGHVLRGSANVIAGQQIIASKTVKLGKRATKTLKFKLADGALDALRTSKGRATVALKLRRAGGKASTVKRSFTLALGKAAPKPPAAPQPNGIPTVTPTTAAPTTTTPAVRWVGRMGTEGAYDDFELTLNGAQITLTKTPLVPVTCAENGDDYDMATSFEPFAVAGPWTVGTDGAVDQQGGSVNPLAGSSARTITYKVTETAMDTTKITGKLGMTYFWSRPDIFDLYKTIFINCFGTQSFEAVPAP
jgi:hypothetical protein